MQNEIMQLTNGDEGMFVIDFYADWCTPCKKLDIDLAEIKGDFKSVKFKKINVEENSVLAESLGIRSIPTLFFIKKNKIKQTLVGAANKSLLTSTINNLI